MKVQSFEDSALQSLYKDGWIANTLNFDHFDSSYTGQGPEFEGIQGP